MKQGPEYTTSHLTYLRQSYLSWGFSSQVPYLILASQRDKTNSTSFSSKSRYAAQFYIKASLPLLLNLASNCRSVGAALSGMIQMDPSLVDPSLSLYAMENRLVQHLVTAIFCCPEFLVVNCWHVSLAGLADALL